MLLHVDDQYNNLCEYIKNNGNIVHNRTGIDRISVFGYSMKFDISNNALPILTTKKVFTNGIIHELLWMISGSNRIKYLIDNNVHIWDQWVKPESVIMEALSVEERIASLTEEQHNQLIADTTPKSDQLGDTNVALVVIDGVPTMEFRDKEVRVNEWLKNNGIKDAVLVDGDLGPIYGVQWAAQDHYELVDGKHVQKFLDKEMVKVADVQGGLTLLHRRFNQISKIQYQLRHDPYSTQIVLNAWNASKIDEMGLPPCHYSAVFNVKPALEHELLDQMTPEQITEYTEKLSSSSPDELEQWVRDMGIKTLKLNCMVTMRSNDIPLGCPFNMVQYALLTHMFAHCANMLTGELFYVIADAHIYMNQLEGIDKQLQNEPKYEVMPKVKLNPEIKNIEDFTFSDIEILDYKSHPVVHFPRAAK